MWLSKKVLFLVVALMFTSRVYAQLKLPRLISDGVVLQRDQPITIWGWDSPSQMVHLIFQAQSYSTFTGEDGKWKIELPALKPGGPYSMSIEGSSKKILKDVMVGDVWLCSGQSNMELAFNRLKDQYPDEVKNADNPAIRQFIVPVSYNFESAYDDVVGGVWESVNQETIYRFSGVAYFFAKELHQKYNVPIGIIRSAAGGTPAEAWIDEESVKKFPHYYQTLLTVKKTGYMDSVQYAERRIQRQWTDQVYLNDEGINASVKWFSPEYDDQSWSVMQVPSFWSDEGLKNFNGTVWFRKKFDVPSAWVGKPVRLYMGNIVDCDSIYINGKFVGSIQYQYPPRKYELPIDLLKEKDNLITVRVINYNGKGGFYAGKPYQLESSLGEIDLRGLWKFKEGVKQSPRINNTFFQNNPTGLYKAMIVPLLNFGIKGIAWYQGESNVKNPTEYEHLMRSLIQSWRNGWKKDLPFIYVQLPNYQADENQPASNWVKLRDVQRKLQDTDNVAMVSILDVGEWNDIHPTNKKDVGERLARAAQKIAYKENITATGPMVKNASTKGSKITLTFDHVGSGLVSKDQKPLRYFEVSGADGKFYPATAKIKRDILVVESKAVKNPITVRYAWLDNPENINFYNKDGLPASTFEISCSN
jgi:sialate O-acetylesterase